MEGARPEYFYKYVSSNVAQLVLQNRTLQWSTPSRLNDPFDIQFDLYVEIDEEKLRQLTLQKLWDAWYGPSYTPYPTSKIGGLIIKLRPLAPKLSREAFNKRHHSMSDASLKSLLLHLPEQHKATREAMAKGKILCFSAVGDSLPMWSYYAENHQGAVLRFKPMDHVDSIHRLARPINYTQKMPLFFDEDVLSNIVTGIAITDSEDMLNRLVYTKAKAWDHEQEWRLFVGLGRAPDQPVEYLPFDAQELDAVILGCCMTEERQVFLSDLTKNLYPHVKVIQAIKSDREFKLIIPA
jgi:hypothetical protein